MINPGPMPPRPIGEVDWHNIPAWGYVEPAPEEIARFVETCTLCGGSHDWRWHYGGDN